MTKDIEILLEQASPLADQPFNIEIRGLPPQQLTTIQMRLDNYYNINAPMRLDPKVPWTSEASFLSDVKGKVSCKSTPALVGSYTGIAQMGLFFNAKPSKQKLIQLSSDMAEVPLFADFELKITVIVKGKIIATRCFKRYFQIPNIVSQNLTFKRAYGRFFYPENQTALPSIIVLSGSDGRIEKAQNIAQVLASHGFASLALAYFGFEGLAQHLERIPLEIIKDALSFLQAQSQLNSTRIGLYGRSKGAEFALLAATTFPDQISCLVLNSPTNISLEGIKGWKNSKTSSWTYDGQELPYTRFSWRYFLKEKWLGKSDLPINPASILPVERVEAPLLVIASTCDEIWPATQAAWKIKERASSKTLEIALYPNCGHMMTLAYQPNSRYKRIPWERILQDNTDSWQKTVNFFKRYL
ncbi:acyl-CoA thioesterase/bile acid-CoA:amino acid N-acyltransferase family protein [Streptococcus massiliensis]|uniref:Putative thioesterase n=1 Tax=Streptococcus massiliensis TaxID=313439 RepID=A0A380KY04_9STRE|nr:acyl-CoA thioesterase/bile acid-CoA:amino acid N-acyltransferase family protein [Streptococcus massiliensis]SUN76505.1 putative thioesterase [Streptococcus massiliensis]